MFPLHELKSVTLELTTNCNASCPQCSRNLNGGSKIPSLPLADLSLAEIEIIFPRTLVQQLSSIRLTGNYGDPMVSKDSLAVCRYFREVNPELNLTFHTNGSGRANSWWQELAKLVTECFFAIDGLEDTNGIYRRNTNWTHIMNSVGSFIGGGGVASWNFLIFEHNQHQVREAADLARRLGFRNFYAKKTGRFLRGGKVASGTPIYNNNGELVGELRPPTERCLLNPAVVELTTRYKTDAEFNEYLQTTSIACKAKSNHSIFVNAQGLVFPCCWTSPIYDAPGQNPRRDQIRSLILEHGGFDQISALKRPIKDILNDDLFTRHFPAGWEQGASNRLLVCSKQCGTHRVARAQHTDSLI